MHPLLEINASGLLNHRSQDVHAGHRLGRASSKARFEPHQLHLLGGPRPPIHRPNKSLPGATVPQCRRNLLPCPEALFIFLLRYFLCSSLLFPAARVLLPLTVQLPLHALPAHLRGIRAPWAKTRHSCPVPLPHLSLGMLSMALWGNRTCCQDCREASRDRQRGRGAGAPGGAGPPGFHPGDVTEARLP